LASLKETTGRSLADNSFASVEEARQFVARLGFQLETRPIADELDRLTSLDKSLMTREQAEHLLHLPGQLVFVLRR